MGNPVVHLELQTPNLPRACDFYSQLFGWRIETVRSYLTMALGEGIQGGVVECDGEGASWVPYVEVADIAAATERGHRLGAAVSLCPREGPAGWRSVLEVPDGAEIALWQFKR